MTQAASNKFVECAFDFIIFQHDIWYRKDARAGVRHWYQYTKGSLDNHKFLLFSYFYYVRWRYSIVWTTARFIYIYIIRCYFRFWIGKFTFEGVNNNILQNGTIYLKNWFAEIWLAYIMDWTRVHNEGCTKLNLTKNNLNVHFSLLVLKHILLRR